MSGRWLAQRWDRAVFEGARVLVTGGTGLIGSHFVEALLRRGSRVRIVVHCRRSPFGRGVETIAGDLRDPSACVQATTGVDYVIHAAGVSGGSKRIVVDPIPMFTDSLLINTNLLEAARLTGVRRYLFVSNSSVYARSNDSLLEVYAWGENARGVPENEAGVVKRTGETQCRLYAGHSDLQIGIIRAGNAYGPRDNFDLEGSHVIPALVRKAVERQDPYVVWGSGETVRDFIHARDIAQGGLAILEQYCECDPVNVATGHVVTIKELVQLVLDLSGHAPKDIRFDVAAPPASPAKWLDTTKMQALGIRPQMSLEDGLGDTIQWYRRISTREELSSS